MTVMETKTAAARGDIYISSVNGISENGEILNIDNTGNRVEAITYDPLHGIALIYEIQGNYEKAVNTYDRILENLKEEWNFSESEPVNVILKEKQRLMELMVRT